GRLHGVISELALDVVAHRVDGDVLAQIVAGDLHHAVVGAPPRARGGPVAAGDDDAARSRQDVLRPKALGHPRAEGRGGGDADGSAVAILGDPCPEWTIADLSAQALGAVTYGIYPTSAPGEVRYLLEHGGARVVIVEDQEHLDKTLAVLDDAPGVRGVIVVDTRALFMYRSTRVHRFADIEAAGRALAPVDALARLAAGVRPDDAATIVYTSGTTGHPKGALYRHGQHLAACANILAHYPILTDGEHRVVAMLPLCHTMGRNTVITMPLLADIVPHYPESLATVAESLSAVALTFVFTLPHYLTKCESPLL